MNPITKEDLRDRLGNIDQIRDIIFGAQLRDYDDRLTQIETNLTLLQQEMRDRIEQVRDSLSTELKTAVEGLDKKLKTYHLSAQEESLDLRQQLDRVNRKFSTGIQTLDEAVDSQTTAIHSELTQTKLLLQEEVLALRDLILEELDRRFSDLKTTKVAKDDLAETLLELGMRLKGGEVIPKLQEATREDAEELLIPLLTTRKMTEL